MISACAVRIAIANRAVPRRAREFFHRSPALRRWALPPQRRPAPRFRYCQLHEIGIVHITTCSTRRIARKTLQSVPGMAAQRVDSLDFAGMR